MRITDIVTKHLGNQQFYAAPAPGKNIEVAPVAPAATLLNCKPAFPKQTKAKLRFGGNFFQIFQIEIIVNVSGKWNCFGL
jgi:hypothetical protein